MNLAEEINKKSMEIASKNAEIIENECKMIMEKFKCIPEDLIIQYHTNATIRICINASEFSIENEFTVS